MNNSLVVIIGIGTVFIGLISIVILCKIVSWCCQIKSKNSDVPYESETVIPAPVSAPTKKAEIPNRREVVAAIATAIAEDLGTDVSAIRILSIEAL